ncbi:hypothetical protein RJ639_017307 [Escallonia herrerae]|uniref:Ribose-5-phosphate isomerase n=1 Tax=Escallonia herrerae TaxID=1293975 RepID=A0AA88VBY6_9ASTE|nr:hypothetical protein RJ639_017307 [Escallonia herrerae]
MVLGLGTGSTAAFVVAKLGALLKSDEQTNIVGVPTSKQTQEQAAGTVACWPPVAEYYRKALEEPEVGNGNEF